MVNIHGNWTIQVDPEHHRLVTECLDSWNEAGAEAFCKEYMEQAERLASESWVGIVDVSDWQFGVEEIWQPIEELNKWAVSKGQFAEIYVCNGIIKRKMMEDMGLDDLGAQVYFVEDMARAHQMADELLNKK